jgi:hypothetical protein
MHNLLKTNIFLVALLLSACKADVVEPPGGSLEPVFVQNAVIDGVPVRLAGGEGGYYLFADNQLDSNYVGNFLTGSGSFAAQNCPSADCPETLTFWFRSMASDTFERPVAGHLAYALRSNNDLLYRTRMTPSDTTSLFTWIVNNTPLADWRQPVQLVLDNDEWNEITLAAQTSAMKSLVTRRFRPSSADMCPVVNLTLESAGNVLLANASATGSFGALNYEWSNGTNDIDAFYAQDSTLQPVAVTVTDANGCVTIASITPTATNYSTLQAFGFEVAVQPVETSQQGGVVIEWADAQGHVWRSDAGNQRGDQFFEVLSVEDFVNNAAGQPTVLCHIRYRCRLFSVTTGTAITLEGAGTVGIALP